MQDSFIDFDYSQEVNNYFPEDYDLNNEIIDEFQDSSKKVDDFKITLLILQSFEIMDSFYYALLYTIRYQSKNKKNECLNDDELKKDLENDQLYDKLFAAQEN